MVNFNFYHYKNLTFYAKRTRTGLNVHITACAAHHLWRLSQQQAGVLSLTVLNTCAGSAIGTQCLAVQSRDRAHIFPR